MSDIRATAPRTMTFRAGEIFLRLVTAAGLAIDAYVHADLANTYDPVAGTISQGTLFRIEAGVSSFAALVVIVTGFRLAYAFAFMVAASALGGILLYRYVNVGAMASLPSSKSRAMSCTSMASIPKRMRGPRPTSGSVIDTVLRRRSLRASTTLARL